MTGGAVDMTRRLATASERGSGLISAQPRVFRAHTPNLI